MKIVSLIFLFFLWSTAISAQMYENSLGLRLGYSDGIYFEKQNSALESYRYMLGKRDGGYNFTAMRIEHKYKTEQMFKMFSAYYGYGAHIGYVKWYDNKSDREHGYYWEQKAAWILGLDAIFGISYDLRYCPVSFTFDVKPFFDLIEGGGLKIKSRDFAFGAVYYF